MMLPAVHCCQMESLDKRRHPGGWIAGKRRHTVHLPLPGLLIDWLMSFWPIGGKGSAAHSVAHRMPWATVRAMRIIAVARTHKTRLSILRWESRLISNCDSSSYARFRTSPFGPANAIPLIYRIHLLRD